MLAKTRKFTNLEYVDDFVLLSIDHNLSSTAHGRATTDTQRNNSIRLRCNANYDSISSHPYYCPFSVICQPSYSNVVGMKTDLLHVVFPLGIRNDLPNNKDGATRKRPI